MVGVGGTPLRGRPLWGCGGRRAPGCEAWAWAWALALGGPCLYRLCQAVRFKLYLPVPCLYPAYTLPIPCLYPAYTLPIPCLYPACTLPVPCVV